MGFTMMDTNGDGVIDMDEYWGMIEMAGLEMDRELIDMAHAMMDMNGDGNIDFDEYMMATMGDMNMDYGGEDMGPMPPMTWHGPMSWGDMIWNECAMNQRIRIDGSCHTCKKPYVQSQDGRACEFVGRREYGGVEAAAATATSRAVEAETGDYYMGRLSNYKQYGKGFYRWTDSGNDYYGMWLNG